MAGRMRRRLALLALSAAACDALPFFDPPKNKKKKANEDDAEADATATNTATNAPAPPGTPKKPVVVYDTPERPSRNDAGLMDKPNDLVRAIEDELGEGARVLGVTIYYDYAMIEARDAAKPTRKRKFTHRGGALREWDQKVSIDYDEEKLAREEFALSEVDWQALPKTTKDAISRVEAEYGQLAHVNIRRAASAKGIELHYHLKTDNRSAMVAYTGKGRFIELRKN